MTDNATGILWVASLLQHGNCSEAEQQLCARKLGEFAVRVRRESRALDELVADAMAEEMAEYDWSVPK